MNSRQKEVQQVSLQDEKLVLKRLRQIYSQASNDCADKIAELGARTDVQNLQSIIYQQQYQKALKKQLDSLYTSLQTDSFTTLSEYLTKCYENGYVGTMYDLQGQSIPVITPIDQKQLVKAVQTDAPLSQGYYDRLGEDVDKLKKATWQQVSRGIANGSSWYEVAQQLKNSMTSPARVALYNAQRIARTEGHRIQQEAQLDALYTAQDNGADVVKQWDATLDGRTRPDHQAADGQIRELDDYFNVGGEKMKAPGVGGSAWNVCNCRCCMLQRARWALDEDELKTLQDRAAYFGLDKSADFDDFKQKYLKVTYNPVTNSDESAIIFTPAKTIKEAETFARDTVGIDNVSYKGVSLDVANAMNESLTNAVNYCPKIKEQMHYYGSAQEGNRLLKSELTTYYTKVYEDYYLQMGYSAAQAAKYGTKYGKSAASKIVGRLESNVYAIARSGKCSSNAPDEVKQIMAKYSGVSVNTAFGKDYSKMESGVKSDVAAKWHPVGCESVRSVFDHEFGHQLDYAYDLRSNMQIQQMFNSSTKTEIKDSLSEYGSKNIAEFIAEAYSEYVNNPSARQTAQTIGSIIEKKVNGK